MPNIELHHGDCLDVLPTLEPQSFDLVFTDPPYPHVKRAYGTLDGDRWRFLIDATLQFCRSLLKPSGSAVIILQPNSTKVGSMRPWVWDFLSGWSRAWNVVQDSYWWNTAAPPSVHTQRRYGLLRPSVKLCVWLGDPDCYRNQDAVLWAESERSKAMRAALRADRDWLGSRPHDQHQRYRQTTGNDAADERGGVTPYNLLPLANTASRRKGAGHEGQTPKALTHWWLSYLCPPGGRVLDPFAGTGTTLQVASSMGLDAVGIEKHEDWFKVAQEALDV